MHFGEKCGETVHAAFFLIFYLFIFLDIEFFTFDSDSLPISFQSGIVFSL